jgi:hypothetical protein
MYQKANVFFSDTFPLLSAFFSDTFAIFVPTFPLLFRFSSPSFCDGQKTANPALFRIVKN